MSKLRFITATSLFDGHDVSINIIRRLLQSKGLEIIHLGHNRSAHDVVKAALHEDADGIALSSYQGGHTEYFTYIRDLLNQANASHIKIFAGGGGVITPKEIKHLHDKNIARIYSPEDGMKMGLVGMIDDMISSAKSSVKPKEYESLYKQYKQDPSSVFDFNQISKIITQIENHKEEYSVKKTTEKNTKKTNSVPVLGITGTGGAGKSSLIDELLLRFNQHIPDYKIALISIDPTKKKTQGALLGDRIRLGSASCENFYIRSLATRDSNTELSPSIKAVTHFLTLQNFDLIIIETSGIGQASDAITKIADKCMYVMTSEYGAATQLEKIEMLESADFIVINKFEKARSEDALRDIRKQYRRNHQLFLGHPGAPEDEDLPIFGTMASHFNDKGVNALFVAIQQNLFSIKDTYNLACKKQPQNEEKIISPSSILYLRDIANTCKKYNQDTKKIVQQLKDYESVVHSAGLYPDNDFLKQEAETLKLNLAENILEEITTLDKIIAGYDSGEHSYFVRGKEFKIKSKYQSLSHNFLSRVGVPRLNHLSDKYQFIATENLPGCFPFATGIFPFKRTDEDPKRMFAGEGGPLRTNKRFHFLSKNDDAKRLSTAFDSATLYGEDPDIRPDIFGKIGEAGVNIATLDDMKILYSGFDLIAPKTSVSMTINGPAPIILAMFMNTVIAQNLSEKDFWDTQKRVEIMRKVRGTVQADILKEDQAQNTCIFSIETAIKMMGDVQEYFCKKKIKNYYTVSISGYHIAEAGANPITQMAFTLSNAFTYIEYYLNRGMHIDDFAPNLSFFFSNGLDPEYSVMGRVARKIWAISMRNKYKANVNSQKFKYHIQTSGRSLHAQEIDFNDIRTTLQAFLAFSDNCNSLHTNAYDEAITTPTEESVRRAMAIQMIINREFGLNKSDNPLQGSFVINELCEIVEDAVLKEFEKISDKGGVLGSMESMYQRSKIQEESLHYETLKDSGELPLIGVNTYIADNIDEQLNQEIELSRTTNEEKQDQINRLNTFKQKHIKKSAEALKQLEKVALSGENIFEELLYTVNFCSLGEITHLLYKAGGQYRRNM